MTSAAPARRSALHVHEFHHEFWAKREPVILAPQDADATSQLLDRHQSWAPAVIFDDLRARREDVAPQQLWYDMAEGVLLDRRDLPDFVRDHVYGPQHLTRSKHYRLFFHPKGHATGLHYEGNLLDVWTFQLKGTKRWRLLRGDTVQKLLPFYFLDNQVSYDPVGAPPAMTWDFELQEGELLYLPRGWYHHVDSLTDDNVSLSVVSAPKDVAELDCVTLRVYREQLALQYHLRAVLPRRFADKVNTFITHDARGRDWTRHYIAGIGWPALLRRLAVDLGIVTPALIGSLLLHRRSFQYMKYVSAVGAGLQRNLDRR